MEENISVIGKIITEGYDDFQRIRIASVNRIRDIVRKRIENIGLKEVEKKKGEKDYNKKYTDTVLFKKLDLIHDEHKISEKEYKYMTRCKEIMKDSKLLEQKYKKAMLDYISDELIFTEFLNKIKGIGPILSANLIKNLGDCELIIYDKDSNDIVGKEIGDPIEFEKVMELYKRNPDKYKKQGYETVSQLWSHCGQSVINGIAPKRKKGETISYNPKLKTLVWKISDTLLKLNKGYYRQIYDTEKEKQLNKEYPKGFLEEKYNGYKKEDIKLSKGHAHARALRKMRKIFLDHYWHCAREIVGLPAQKNYVEGVLNHNHVVSWKQALEMENENEK